MNSIHAGTRTQTAFRWSAPGLGVVLCVMFGVCDKASADCKWPPLNPIKEEYSHTEHVAGVPFTSSYHEWQVPSYRIDDFHCSDSVDIGPYHWSLTIGGEVHSTRTFEGRGPSTPAQRPLPAALPDVPALPQFPPYPSASLPSLPSVPQLATLQALPQIPPLN